jgi:N-acetylglucosamine-6-sulfatase
VLLAAGALGAGIALWNGREASAPVIDASSIVMLGDSITAEGDWSALLPEYPITNMGYSGATTEQLIPVAARLAPSRPGIVFVLTGTNDLRDDHPPEWTAARLDELLDLFEPGTTVIVQTIMPRADRPEEAAAIADAIRTTATARGLRVLDLYTAFDDGNGGLIAAETTDGVHLTAAGYDRWVAELRPVLAELAG